MSVQLNGSPGPNLRQRTTGWPMRGALVAVAAVWLLGCVWSYREQSEFAAAKGFTFPHLLPLVIDGLAVAMAGVSWAASLDARPAVPARLATLLAVAGSAASNGTWAWIRTGTATATAGGAGHDRVAVALGVAVPVAANLAFEVLLAELRRQVQRGRGLPPPVAIPQPRMVRIALAPWTTLQEWRALVLEVTRPAPASVTYLSGRRDPVGATRPAPSTVSTAPIDAPPSAVTSPDVHTDNPSPDQVHVTNNDKPPGGDERPHHERTPDCDGSPPIPPAEPVPAQEPAAAEEPAPPRSHQSEDAEAHHETRGTDATTPATSAPTGVAPQVTVTAPRSAPSPARTLELVTRSPAVSPARHRRAGDTTTTSASAGPPPAPPASGQPPERDARVTQLLALLRKGERLTGTQAARILKCSDRTGRRLLRIAQELHDRDSATLTG